jgi:hypothetical protein
MENRRLSDGLLFVVLGLVVALLLHANGIAPFNAPACPVCPIVIPNNPNVNPNNPCPCGPNCPCKPNQPHRPHNGGSLGAVDETGKTDPAK